MPRSRSAPLPAKPTPTTTPLTAFGGWSDADWFCATILSDPDVVAFELPKLPGLRKQNFHVIDRALTKAPAAKAKAGAAKPAQLPERAPRRLAGRLAVLLDDAGAQRAVASCRSRLLFEAGPVLFFADLPTARLKPRAAAKLRRALVEIGVTACVLHQGADLTTLMFWPAAEAAITEFVAGAAPDQPLHAEFSGAAAAPARRAAAPAGGEREARLLQQIAVLQAQVTALSQAQSARGAMEQLGLDDRRLKAMLVLLHPDKHQNSAAATEAATWINGMRDLLKAK